MALPMLLYVSASKGVEHMQFNLSINLDGSSFDSVWNDEGQRNGFALAYILDELATKLNHSDLTVGAKGYCRDINGNTVGAWEIVEGAGKPRGTVEGS